MKLTDKGGKNKKNVKDCKKFHPQSKYETFPKKSMHQCYKPTTCILKVCEQHHKRHISRKHIFLGQLLSLTFLISYLLLLCMFKDGPCTGSESRCSPVCLAFLSVDRSVDSGSVITGKRWQLRTKYSKSVWLITLDLSPLPFLTFLNSLK